MPHTPTRGWQHSVVHQVWPRSCCDSNDGGIGDILGITSRPGHLQAPGVDVVWPPPVCASPDADNGHGISGYRAIAPQFGSMAEFDTLLAALHARGMQLVIDLVVTHTAPSMRVSPNPVAQPVGQPLDTLDATGAAVRSAHWPLALGPGALCHGGALHHRVTTLIRSTAAGPAPTAPQRFRAARCSGQPGTAPHPV